MELKHTPLKTYNMLPHLDYWSVPGQYRGAVHKSSKWLNYQDDICQMTCQNFGMIHMRCC